MARKPSQNGGNAGGIGWDSEEAGSAQAGQPVPGAARRLSIDTTIAPIPSRLPAHNSAGEEPPLLIARPTVGPDSLPVKALGIHTCFV